MATVDELIDKAIGLVHNVLNVSDEDLRTKVIDDIKEINTAYQDVKKIKYTDREKLADALAKEGLIDMFCKVHSAQTADKFFEEPFLTNAKKAKGNMWNLSDASNEVSERIGKSDIYEMLVKNLNTPEFHYSKMKNKDGTENKSLIYSMKADLGIMMNSLRRVPKNKYKFREVKGIEAVVPLIKSTFLIVKTKAIFTLAYAGDPDDTTILKSTSANIEFIIKKILEPAVESETHVGKRYSFSVEEVLESVHLMAMNDDNSLKMVELGILDVVLNVVDDPHKDKELYFALKLVWRLSFAAKNKKILGQSERLFKTLKKLTSKTDLTLENKNAVDGAWMELSDSFKEYLDSKLVKSDLPDKYGVETKMSSAHCMISYSWANQQLALRIKEELRSRNIPVWMDVEKMEGDVLTKMADAVESSFAVIICLSDAYKDSSACRSEASYAYKCKKQLIPVMMEADFAPKGWLGLLVGTSLYYNLFRDSEFDMSIEKIIGFISKESEIKVESASVTNSAPKPASGLELWTNEKTTDWLKNQMNITEVLRPLSNLDGKALKELQYLLKSQPEFTINFIRTELGVKEPIEFLHLLGSLRNL